MTAGHGHTVKETTGLREYDADILAIEECECGMTREVRRRRLVPTYRTEWYKPRFGKGTMFTVEAVNPDGSIVLAPVIEGQA